MSNFLTTFNYNVNMVKFKTFETVIYLMETVDIHSKPDYDSLLVENCGKL